MRIYELTPGGYDRAKSFYGKAKVIEKDGETLLQSYDTTAVSYTHLTLPTN